MGPKQRALIRDALIVAGVLAILTLLAHGQVAATILVLVPLVFLVFGRRPD
jgi:sulfur transfer protein SufE